VLRATPERGAIVLLRPAIGHHDDHRHGFTFGNEVVEQDFRVRKTLPLGFIDLSPISR
jgi:hypothetical protein